MFAESRFSAAVVNAYHQEPSVGARTRDTITRPTNLVFLLQFCVFSLHGTHTVGESWAKKPGAGR